MGEFGEGVVEGGELMGVLVVEDLELGESLEGLEGGLSDRVKFLL